MHQLLVRPKYSNYPCAEDLLFTPNILLTDLCFHCDNSFVFVPEKRPSAT